MNASIQTFYFITVITRRPTTLAHVHSCSFACVCCIRWRSTHGGLALRSSVACVLALYGLASVRVLAFAHSRAYGGCMAIRRSASMRCRRECVRSLTCVYGGCLFVALSAGKYNGRAIHTWTVNAASKGSIRFVTVSLSLAIHLPWPLGFASPQPRLRARRFNFSVSVVTIRCAQHLYRPHWPGKRHPQ